MIRRVLQHRDETRTVSLQVDLSPPTERVMTSMQVDRDVFKFFDQNGTHGRSTRMHRVLRAFVDAQRRRNGPHPERMRTLEED